MTIIFFSGNLHKAREISVIFAEAEVRIYTEFMKKIEVVENGSSFAQNAKIKLNALKSAFELQIDSNEKLRDLRGEKIILMAEDSGICVESLDNLPNIFSARFANLPKNFIDSPSLAEGARGWVDSTDSENIARLISELKARNLSESKASFISCVACKILQFANSNENSAEVSLDNFVGFQARNCEIEHRVHRAVECAESRESAKETNARDEREQPKLRPIIKGANGLSLGISIVVAIMLGIGAGVLMQKIFGVFWVLFLGVAWGIAAAILNVYKVYKAELRDFEKIANDPKYKRANP